MKRGVQVLISTKELLILAETHNFAVPCFNTYDQYTTAGIVRGAEQAKAAIMIALGTKTLRSYSCRAMLQLVQTLAEGTAVPVAIHLDHAADPQLIQEWMEFGGRSAMVDGSTLPDLENLTFTAQVSHWVHQYPNAWLEAELGRVEGSEDVNQSLRASGSKTDPTFAREFAERTGVDALAVSIGNVHGRVSADIQLDVQLLQQIKQVVEIPLVLHGASGVSRQQLQECIGHGVRKVNFNFDVRSAAIRALEVASQREVAHDTHNFFSVYDEVQLAVANTVAEKCETVGSANKSGLLTKVG